MCVCVCLGGGGLSESVKKRKCITKIFFQMLSEALKISEKWYMISADLKSNIKQQEIKDLVAASYKFL